MDVNEISRESRELFKRKGWLWVPIKPSGYLRKSTRNLLLIGGFVIFLKIIDKEVQWPAPLTNLTGADLNWALLMIVVGLLATHTVNLANERVILAVDNLFEKYSALHSTLGGLTETAKPIAEEAVQEALLVKRQVDSWSNGFGGIWYVFLPYCAGLGTLAVLVCSVAGTRS